MTAAQPQSTSLRHRLRRLLVGTGTFLAVLVALAAVAFAQQVQRQDAVTQDLFNAIVASDGAYIRLIDAETGLRGYAITGERASLAPYEDAVASGISFDAIVDAIDRVGVAPSVLEAASRADRSARAWLEDYAAPLVAQIEADGPQSVQPGQVDRGQEQFDQVRLDVAAFVDELREMREGISAELTSWTRAASTVVGVLAVVAVTVGVVLWFALRRWVVEPLESVAHDVRQVASGELGHAVRAEGPDEVVAMARDVELMRVALVDQVRSVETARAEVEDAHARLAERAEELHRSNRDLEQFAYVASHDLQEPLRKVASFTQLLQKRYGGQLDERADQYIDFAVDGAKRMQRLIQDLLGFSRVGRTGTEVVDVDLAAALATATDQLSEAIEETGAVVTHDPLPTVRGEQPLLVQLFQNLVGNAVKFRSPDRTPLVHVSARRVTDAWELVCADNGIGIDEQYAERVFVIFQRLHAKDVYDGTGIGLALCKKIVEFHRGTIWIEQPADGVGTRICWTIPDERPEQPSPTGDQPGAPQDPIGAPRAQDGATP
ncbi:sensor histidine kinase [Cellulomonas sp.]|uniref:sensor histidine kinase n=1 Tax=Cellulomonas sp. TaxID=40001 RepID=UPI00258B86AD|nr:sensor histidine kinase [Cellulomonas sp.]MCR6689723.1 ATP-binding protein [Cellulomonas sp.]